LEEFVQERGLEGTILVSDLGPEGKIGRENIKSLVIRIYKLRQLNEQYGEFIEKFSHGNFSKAELAFTFYSILGNDPQLPFEVLPEDWRGEEAYRLFKEKLT
jgi:DNA-binding transcriptional regulator PaaX